MKSKLDIILEKVTEIDRKISKIEKTCRRMTSKCKCDCWFCSNMCEKFTPEDDLTHSQCKDCKATGHIDNKRCWMCGNDNLIKIKLYGESPIKTMEKQKKPCRECGRTN